MKNIVELFINIFILVIFSIIIYILYTAVVNYHNKDYRPVIDVHHT